MYILSMRVSVCVCVFITFKYSDTLFYVFKDIGELVVFGPHKYNTKPYLMSVTP
jgi:hypothetical protein